jgi:hypothetical protein
MPVKNFRPKFSRMVRIDLWKSLENSGFSPGKPDFSCFLNAKVNAVDVPDHLSFGRDHRSSARDRHRSLAA